jgi:hypothetical protein
MSTRTSDGWSRCPPGTFRRLGAVLAARQLRRLWLTRFALVVGALLAVAACWETAVVIDDWVYATRPKPTIPCAPTAPATNPITPDGQAPTQAPGCGK